MSAPSSAKPATAAPGSAGAASAKSSPSAGKPAAAPAAPKRVDLRTVWPIPALMLSGGLLAAGLYYGLSKAPQEDPGEPFSLVQQQMNAEDFEAAIETLNSKLIPPLQRGKLSPEQQEEFFLTRARALYEGQAKLGISLDANHRAILDDYAEAQKLKAKLLPADFTRIAGCYLALGQMDKALESAQRLDPDAWATKSAIYRAIADYNLAQKDPRYDQTLGVLSALETSPKSSPDDRAWAMIRQAKLRLAMDYHEEAITRLLRAMPLLNGISASNKGELLRLLGKAYFEIGHTEEAMSKLEAALATLPPSDPSRDETELLLSRLLQSQGKHEDARDRLALLLSHKDDGPIALQSRAILAECASALGDDAEALRFATESIERAEADAALGRSLGGFSAQELGASLLSMATDRAGREQHAAALPFADLSFRAYVAANTIDAGAKGRAKPASEHGAKATSAHQSAGDSQADAHGTGPAPAEPSSPSHAAGSTRQDRRGIPAAVYAAMAVSHRKVAEQILDEARRIETGLLRIDQISPATRAEVKRHFLDAGAAFVEHATLLIVADPAASAGSLWQAADCFDLAGDREGAKRAFSAYAASASDNDPRKTEARARLAQVLQAEREYVAAAAQYRLIIEQRATPGQPGGPGNAGLTADRALVPLARCLLADNDPLNDDEAEKILTGVLSGATFTPDAPEYREALLELGERCHATGRYAEAATHLEEALVRYPDGDESLRIVFKLADSYRQSSAQIAEELKAALPQDKRDELLQLRQTRLARAAELFNKVGSVMASRSARHITALDRLLERNATFYEADCAFELEDYAKAVRLYDVAAQRYATDPASLLARVQIVSCYLRMGRAAEAAAANERAKRQLAGIPQEAFDKPDMPMSRKHWERWLAAELELQDRKNGVTRSTSAGAP